MADRSPRTPLAASRPRLMSDGGRRRLRDQDRSSAAPALSRAIRRPRPPSPAAGVRQVYRAGSAGAPETDRSELSFRPLSQLGAEVFDLVRKRWNLGNDGCGRLGIVCMSRPRADVAKPPP